MQDRITAAVVVAAGCSTRMGGGRNKVLNPLLNRPVLSYSLEVFQHCDTVQHVVVVGREEDQPEIESIIQQYCAKAKNLFVAGGAERFDSVRNGLNALQAIQPEYVLIQDAARPFLQESFIQDAVDALRDVPGCVTGVPLKDTLKETDADHHVVQTHDRSKYWLAQTPQSFQYPIILKAYNDHTPPPYPTDDGAVLEEAGFPVTMLMGSYHNFKITTPEDVLLAEALMQANQKSSEK